MQSHGGAAAAASSKKPKSREVSSRFLSPTSSTTTTSSSTEYPNQSPNSTLSPLKHKPRSSPSSRKHKSLQNSGFLRGLWPGSSNSNPKPDTLADHLGNDRLKDLEEERKNIDKSSQNSSSFLNRQRSCTEFSRFDEEKKKIYKENHKPVFGGSMRYNSKFKFTTKSSSDTPNDHIIPGRFSVDENELRKKSIGKGLSDSDSEYSDICTSFDTPASYMAPTVSSRKHGIEVPSRFMHDLSSSRSRRWSADSNNNSPKIFSLKNAVKGNANWAGFSPGRSSGSPKNGLGLTNSKPPTSPSKGKGVGNILSMGIELLKGRKSSSSNSSATSPLGPGSVENVHQLRLLHNRLIQWMFSNARAEHVNANVIKQAESNLLYVWGGLIKLRHSALLKKLQLQKEKLEMKLNYILQSQRKALEMWGSIERQHLSNVSTTKDHLHAVVCRIPLVDGAKVEPKSAAIAVRHASDIAASINMMVTTYSPTIEETVGVVGELATVITQEKLLLEECFELFNNISALQIQEKSLMSSIMQLRILSQQQHHYQPYILE